MQKGIINKTDIQKAEKILLDMAEFEEWMIFIKANEPDYYNFLQESTARMVASINAVSKLNYEDTRLLAQNMFMAFCCSYIIEYGRKESLVSKIINAKYNDKFQLWLEGKLGDEFYRYSTRGMKKNASMYTAKANHDQLVALKMQEEDRERAKKKFTALNTEIEFNTPAAAPSPYVKDEEISL